MNEITIPLEGSTDKQYYHSLILLLQLSGQDVSKDIIKSYLDSSMEDFNSSEDKMIYLFLSLNQYKTREKEFKSESFDNALKLVNNYMDALEIEGDDLKELFTYGLLFKTVSFIESFSTDLYYKLIDLVKSNTDSDVNLVQFCIYFICLAVTEDYVKNKVNIEEYPSELIDMMVKAREVYEKVEAAWFR